MNASAAPAAFPPVETARLLEAGRPSSTTGRVRVSIVICSYSLDRFDQLVACVASVLDQSRAADEVVVVIDHNEALRARAVSQFPDVEVVPNRLAQGLSGARNTGVLVSTGDVVAFIDDDATADRDWLGRLVEPYQDPLVLGTGGHIEPNWLTSQPGWFPDEFRWVVGCSYRGLPTSIEHVRNPIGCSMSFRRESMIDAGLFRDGVGRVGANLSGCEETELSIRATARQPGSYILYVPESRVNHLVPAARCTLSYFVRRCYAEGVSKAVLARLLGADASSRNERGHALRTLPRGVGRGMLDTLRSGRPDGLLRSSAIVIGLVAWAAGFTIGFARTFRVRRSLVADAEQ